MSFKKSEAGNFLPMTVIEGITVNVLPHEQYQFLLSTSDVSIGFGVSEYNIRQMKIRHSDELIAGKHYVPAVTICHSDSKTPHNKLYWTKNGIIRLGFFIRSERAKLFRDWAEELIIKLDEQRDLFGASVASASAGRRLPSGRNHNRLTQERMISILADVCRIDDRELRLSITDKLMKGGQA